MVSNTNITSNERTFSYTLPEAYRPRNVVRFPLIPKNTYGSLDSSGRIILHNQSGSNTDNFDLNEWVLYRYE